MKPYEALSETDWVQVERIQDLIHEGETEDARAALDTLRRGRPGQPDLRIVESFLCLEEGEPAQAFEALRGAERSADPAEFFYLRAAAQYELVRFREAKADAERALAIHDSHGDAWDLLSRVLDHMQDPEAAGVAATRAHELDPEAFPLPLEVPQPAFDGMVKRSLLELPKAVRAKLPQMPVLVQDLPSRQMLTSEDPPFPPDVLGLFVGRHIFAEGAGAPADAPGAIYLFRRNLLRACADTDELAREIAITVRHEVGHLMGLDEDELDDWGLA